MNNNWKLLDSLTLESFIKHMLELGTPLETSLVGNFDKTGRGSRRDIPLPLHRDGDYSTQYRGKIDYVGLYCINPSKVITIVEDQGSLHYLNLKKSEALIINNHACRHARQGEVNDRLLFRIWITKT